MKYIIINGFPHSGKTQFIEYCMEELEYKNVANISSIDWIKYLAQINGWDGSKTPENRKFLSDLKNLLIKWGDVPYKKVIEMAKILEEQTKRTSDKEMIIFVDCRESSEIQKFEERNNAISILIRREKVENLEQSNFSDADVLEHCYHNIIYNNGTLEELKEKAKYFLYQIGALNDY